jgi:protein tyrosine/serine phosphatase
LLMKSIQAAILLLVLVALSWAGRAQSAREASNSQTIPRFDQVAKGFYRGGQPRRQGFEYLKQLGVKTVINLRGGNREAEEVKSLGLRYVHIPMRPWKRVPESKIQMFFQVLRDRDSYPVFVHCDHGSDRTGFMVGLYRIAFQDWSADRAYQEARAHGMWAWDLSLKHQLYQFANHRAASDSLSHGPARP